LQAVDDAALTAAFARFMPIYLHDYWARREEFAPFVAGIRAWADPQRGEETEPFDVRSRLGGDRCAGADHCRAARLHLRSACRRDPRVIG
jgi:hypothetical protein